MSTSSRPKRSVEAVRFDCPFCKARPGQPCLNFARPGLTKRPHPERMAEARKAGY